MSSSTLNWRQSPTAPYAYRATRRERLTQLGVILLVGLLLGGYSLLFPRLPLLWGVLSLVVVTMPFVVLAVGDVRRLLLVIPILDIPLQLDGHLFYREALASWGSIAGFNYSLTTIALAGLYTLWLVDWLVQPTEIKPTAKTAPVARVWTTPLWALGCYVACVALSLVVARDRQLAAFELALLVQILLLVIYLVATIRTTAELLFLVRLLLLALLLQSVVMIGLRLLGHSLILGPLHLRIDPDQRVGGAIGGPNTAAGYLALLLPVALALFWSKLDRLTRNLALLALALGCVGLGLTLSRGGTISALIGLSIVFVLCWRRQGWSLGMLCLLGIGSALLLYFGAVPLFAGRMIGADPGAATGRLPLIALALQIIRDAPLLGIGANNFAVVMPDYLTPEFSRDWLYLVHNKYLLIWAELGPVGIGAYLWFLFSTLHLGWRAWQQRASSLAPLALGLTVGIVGHMIHMQVDLFNGRQLVQTLWLQAALITIAARLIGIMPSGAVMRRHATTHHGTSIYDR